MTEAVTKKRTRNLKMELNGQKKERKLLTERHESNVHDIQKWKFK